ncbi:hypothetical protein LPJ61_003258 [Coemansia biformis]|uniref:Major facilitator superfamily (MFS) profile domain-containing protein n=1 Tax=Coemansia biformis TaxID=1286918 RepID=A0A9W8CYT0_9FUNG|nr:hypothetical protein LPJ61_003258 [Coemansia biformis]
MQAGDSSATSVRNRGRLARILRRCNDFRSEPAAVLTVSTLAVFVDTVVYGLIVPFLPEILQDRLGMSSSANGILFGCFGVGVLTGAPISAYISDRWKIRRWPMIIGLLGLAITTVLFAVSNAFWELVVARLAQGIASGITWSIGLGMIADVYPGKAMGQAMGIAFTGFTLGYLGGPVIGGALYDAGGIHAIAIFVAAITAVDLVFRLLLIEPKPASEPAVSSETLDAGPDEKALEDGDSYLPPPGRAGHRRFAAHVAASSPSLTPSPATAREFTFANGICKCGAKSARGPNRIAAQSQPNLGKVCTCSRQADAHSIAASALPAFALTLTRTVDRTNDLPPPAPLKRTTMLDLLREWPILACCLAATILSGTSGALEPTLPLHMRESFNSSTMVTAAVFVAFVIPSAISGPIAGMLSSDERLLAKSAPYGRFGFVVVGVLLAAGVFACLGATKNIVGLVVCLIFAGFLLGFATVPVLNIMGVHVERTGGHAYATVYALFNISYSIGVLVVPTVLPPIMNAIGFAGSMGVLAALLVACACIVAIYPASKHYKHGRAAYIGENARQFL